VTHLPNWKKMIDVTFTIVISGAAFFGTGYLLRIAELRDLAILARKRFRLGGTSPSSES
jgi:hypothetical protein